jgi:prolyl-tRNA editing enzyme YbaK/EbsC (Cys-tRNA(Pro) deacylase)
VRRRRAEAGDPRGRQGGATRQVIGGQAPEDHLAPVRTFLDVALWGYDEVWAAAGIAASLFPISYADLLRVTGATEVEVD